jgi:hypothetical protein
MRDSTVTTKSNLMSGAFFSSYILHLNEFRKNMASNLGQSLSNHSYGYAFSSDWPTLFAILSLIFVPFLNYSGKKTIMSPMEE